jgi:hypothetical protein
MRGLAASMLLLAGTLGSLSLGRLKQTAGEIVSATLPGLSYAGEANANLAQAFNRSLLLMMTDSAEERMRLRKEVEDYSRMPAGYLGSYRNQMFTAAGRWLYDALLERRGGVFESARTNFRAGRANQRRQALALYKTELFPAHQRYKEAGDKPFEYTMRQGTERGRSIMSVCTTTQVVVAALVIFIFIVGLLVGMFR